MSKNHSDGIVLPAREIAVWRDVDIVVVGGGLAGVGAAIAAGRAGARVLLVEAQGFLGGTMTAVTVGSICGEYVLEDGTPRRIVGGLVEELVTRLTAQGDARGPECWLQTATTIYDPFAMRCVLDEMVRDAGVETVMHTRCVDLEKEGGRITGLVLGYRSQLFAVRCRQVIDCTGDGDIADLAGVPWECDLDKLQMPSAMFRFGGVDPEALITLDRAALRARLESAATEGMDLPRTAGGLFSLRHGMVHANVTRVEHGSRSPDPLSVEEMTAAEIEGRRQVRLYEKIFRRFVPGFEKAFVADAGSQVGVRESRRIRGRHVLTADEVLRGARCDTAIACSAWPVEEHGADRKTRWVWLEPGAFYQVPFGCLVPARGPGNLLVAGRCVSAEHDAHASLRVGATCMAMGQAAGLAAAMAADSDTPAAAEIAIDQLQARLTAAHAFLG